MLAAGVTAAAVAAPWAVRLEGVGKRYRLGERSHLNENFREAIMTAFGGALRRRPGGGRPWFWALRDIDLTLDRGQTLGVIGRNGAGKSTLLKILSRITTPSVGTVRYRGRLASLLEVGSGFHRELTGRENIYLNGAILGMKRAEIDGAFDAIVEFAGVETFLDTPVKFYSSGMYVRLAFSIAAHLRGEILVVDEVLAVGDAQFQKKCLEKMRDVAGGGRTVIFVSHNLAAVRALCRQAIWIADGRIRERGPAGPVADAYVQDVPRLRPSADLGEIAGRLPLDPVFRLGGIELRQQGRPANVVLNGLPLEIRIEYEVLEPTPGLRLFLDLRDEDQNILFRSFNDEDEDEPALIPPGRYVSVAVLPPDLLAPRQYELLFQATIYNVRSIFPGGVIVPLRVEGSSRVNRAYPQEPIRGKLLPPLAWRTSRREAS